MVEGLHDRIERERKAALPEESSWDDVRTFRGYYRGRQKGTTSAAQRRILTSVVGNLFCDNICRKVIDEFAGRTVLAGWTVADQTAQAYLDELWTKNALPDLSADAHLATIRDGNHAISLRWFAPNPANPRDGRVTLHRERWWDGKSGVFVSYERDGTPAYAVRDWKEWDDTAGRVIDRRIVWFPNRIERYARNGSGWRPYPLPGREGSEVEAWVRSDGRPLGIPVVHLAKGSDDDGPYGASELDGGVIGMQDEINDVQRDITAAARMTGYQMITATGVKTKDEHGNPLKLNVGPGQTLASEVPQANFGVIPAGDLSQLKTAYMTKLEAVCRMTDTPLHLITGQWPSGEALLRAEMPLVTKAQRLAKALQPAWSTVAHRATELANAFGGLALDEDALIVAAFEPADKRDPLSLAAIRLQEAAYAAAVERLGTSWGMRTAGVPADEITALRTELTARAEAARRLFDAGEPDGVDDEED